MTALLWCLAAYLLIALLIILWLLARDAFGGNELQVWLSIRSGLLWPLLLLAAAGVALYDRYGP